MVTSHRSLRPLSCKLPLSSGIAARVSDRPQMMSGPNCQTSSLLSSREARRPPSSPHPAVVSGPMGTDTTAAAAFLALALALFFWPLERNSWEEGERPASGGMS